MKKPRRADCDRIANSIGDDARAMAALLEDASHVQWERPTRRAAEEAPRAKGVFSDPTAEVALDPRRLRVREAYNDALVAFVRAYDDLSNARSRLTQALEGWKNEN